MRKLMIVPAVAALFAIAVAPTPVQAGSGRVAVGVIGGLAIGTMLGAAIAAPRPYYGPGPVYVEGPPGPAPACYWTRGEPVWDPYIGAWRRPRVQVCD
jgi:hypothetical protein